jgi:hypothetical protein
MSSAAAGPGTEFEFSESSMMSSGGMAGTDDNQPIPVTVQMQTVRKSSVGIFEK